MKLVAVCISVLCATPVIVSCAGKAPLPAAPAAPERPAQTAPEKPAPASATAPAAAPEQVYRETGTASWYGRELQGRRMADGENFDMDGLSAAHRILPLGTVIRVTNIDNYKTINVRVSDRGPFVRSRILELSYGAAKELEFVRQGTARVRIETLEPVRGNAIYTVQAASFVEEENAKLLKERLQRKYETVYITSFESNVGKFYRVRVGAYLSEEKAERVAGKLTLDGLEPVVVRKD
jgi:peptidoglycan lytic transglycosylase